MGPRGGPGAACPDLTIALMTPPVSNFFTALAALDILDILSMCLSCHSSVRPLCLLGKLASALWVYIRKGRWRRLDGSHQEPKRTDLVSHAKGERVIPVFSIQD
ncbi:hypothetical protein PO909_006809 [Leuciscus waleckii]